MAKGIFLELLQNDGTNKSFKMLPDLVPSGLIPMTLGFVSNDDPELTSCISKFSNSAYPQHSGERYRTYGHLILFCFWRQTYIVCQAPPVFQLLDPPLGYPARYDVIIVGKA